LSNGDNNTTYFLSVWGLREIIIHGKPLNAWCTVNAQKKIGNETVYERLHDQAPLDKGAKAWVVQTHPGSHSWQIIGLGFKLMCVQL
jgi:hypothetical protein